MLFSPTGSLPTVHTISMLVVEETVQGWPPIITLVSDIDVAKEVPVMVIVDEAVERKG